MELSRWGCQIKPYWTNSNNLWFKGSCDCKVKNNDVFCLQLHWYIFGRCEKPSFHIMCCRSMLHKVDNWKRVKKRKREKKMETKIENGMANKAFFLCHEEICFFLLCRFIFHQNSVCGCMPWKDFIFHLCFFFQTAGQNYTSGKGWRAVRGRLMTGYLVPLSFKCSSVNT